MPPAARRASELLATLRQELRAAGLRATPSRLAVLALLRRHPGPLSHGDAAEQLAGEPWDKATIYRNLIDLTEAGLARRTDVGDHVWRFEAVDAAHGDAEHPHFVCTGCGSVACLPDLDIGVRSRGRAVARAPRAVRQQQVAVQLRGLCDACN
jgi:Fur family transcriptional regulator, ferric uptake regulator